MYTAVVAAHLNRRKRSEIVFGPANNQRYCGNTSLVFCCVPDTHGYHLYLRTRFAPSSVLAKHASLVNTMAPGQENSRGIVRGIMQQEPPKRLNFRQRRERLLLTPQRGRVISDWDRDGGGRAGDESSHCGRESSWGCGRWEWWFYTGEKIQGLPGARTP